jgi:hypothetical protein
MFNHEFGSVDYYREHFADVIGDVGSSDNVQDNVKTAVKMLLGFKLAVQEWYEYHDACAVSFQELMNEFLDNYNV